MQLTYILTAAFGVLVSTRWQHPHGYSYNQKKGVAQVGNSGLNGNTASNSSTGIGTGTDTGTGTGTDTGPSTTPSTGTGPGTGPGTGTGTGTNIGAPGSCPTILAPPSNNNAGGSTASFTRYSGCNTPSAACGWYSSTGYNAAISQAVYGGAPGSGPGSACGGCWRLAPNFPGANPIVVKINNLCPADENNPICAQPAG